MIDHCVEIPDADDLIISNGNGKGERGDKRYRGDDTGMALVGSDDCRQIGVIELLDELVVAASDDQVGVRE